MEAEKAVLRRIVVDTLDELRIESVLRDRVRCEDGVLEVGDQRIELGRYKKIIVAAIGKAAGPMARTLAELVAPAKAMGVIVSSVDPTAPAPSYFLRYRGGHPYPNEQSFHAASVLGETLSDLREHHLVVYLLSGGGSAICEKPIHNSISLEDAREFYRLLVTCGADIVQMNTLRKHLSAIKGGRLALRAHPARQLTLYVSDVPAGRDSSVASGPTMPDESTVEDCYRLAEELGLRGRLPDSIEALFDRRLIPETPKADDPGFASSSWVPLLDNGDAVAAVRRRCEALGWHTDVDLSVDDIPLADAADVLLDRLKRLRLESPGQTAAVITGGELSSPVHGDGLGGRNQAFVLDCARKIAGQPIAVVSAGTDGVDGNSPAAGAVADGETLTRAGQAGLDAADFEARSDSYGFFSGLGDALVTGPTENNVRDIRILAAFNQETSP